MSDTFLPGSGFDTYESQDKVLVQMDGSRECAVAVRILQQQGFAVAGAAVRLAAEQTAEAESAKKAAEALGIECIVLNAEALAGQDARNAHVQRLHDRLLAGLQQYSLVRVNSPAHAVPHIVNVSVTGVKGTRFQQALSEQGVCVSVKSACSSDGLPSKAVFAVSRDRRNALSSWRISISHLTTDAEIDGFLQAFDTCYKTLTNKEN